MAGSIYLIQNDGKLQAMIESRTRPKSFYKSCWKITLSCSVVIKWIAQHPAGCS